MSLDDLFQIKHKFKLDFITPIVLDYYIIKNDLFQKGYIDNLHEMSICKLNVEYMRNKGYNMKNDN